MDNISWLQNFFSSQCNDDWEHGNGIKIFTLDNPGWGIEIDLNYSDIDTLTIDVVNIQRDDEDDWFFCKVEDGLFKGRGGPNNFNEIIALFRKSVEEHLSGQKTT